MSLIRKVLNWIGLAPGPTDDFWYGPVGTQTAAGVAVDQNTALTYSACWAARMLLCTSGGMLPLKLMRHLDDGGSEPATDHYVYKVIHDEFNTDMTNMMFRSTMMGQQIDGGNCFGEIEFNGALRVKHVWPIHPSRIPKENLKRGPDGKLYYLVNNDDGTKTVLRDWEVFHVPSPISDDGLWGRGVVEQARLTIGFGIATETQGAAYMGNSARPTLVIKGGKFKDKEDREDYRRQWHETFGGASNTGKPALLPPDSDISALNWSAEDSQFLETRQHNIEEVARWYGVPPHLIGHLLRATYSNIEQQSLEFVKYSLMRWLILWEQEINRKLLSAEDRKDHYALHVVEGLERADIKTRTDALKEQFFNGEITLNEWRKLENRNPIGKLGDIHWVQQAMVPLEVAAKGPEQPNQQRDIVEAIQKIYLGVGRVVTPDEARKILNGYGAKLKVPGPGDLGPANPTPQEGGESNTEFNPERNEMAAILERLDRLEAKDGEQKAEQLSAAVLEVVEQVVSGMLEREAKHALEASKNPQSFLKWLDSFYADHQTRLEKALSKPIKAYALLHGGSVNLEDAVQNHIAAGREALLAAASVPVEQFPKSVESCVATWDRRHILSYLGACNGKYKAA